MRVPAFAFLGVIFLGSILAASAAADDWSGITGDQIVSFDDNEYARAVQVLAKDGIHAVWGEDAPSVREVHYGYSADDGYAWTSTAGDRVISFPDGHGVNPEDCDISGSWFETLIVAWSEDVTDTREVHYGISTDNGVTWSSESQDLILSDPASAADTGSPSVIVTEDGTMHVVWTQTSGAGSVEVFYSSSTDGGVTWSGATADRMISFPDGNGAIAPQIVGTSSSLVVVWREASAAGGAALHAGISQDGGATWSSETADREISQPANIITNLAASADACLPNVEVVYTASFNTQSPFHYEVYATSSGDDGATFNGEAGLVPVSFDEEGGRSASNPDVFFGQGQDAVAVWDEEEDAALTNEIHVSRSAFPGPWSGTAGDEIISYPDGEDGYRPSVFGNQCFISRARGLQPSRDTFVLWTEFAGGTTDNYEVHLSANALVTGSAGEGPLEAAGLRVSPNPSGGSIFLDWSAPAEAGAVRVEIFDAAGRCVRELNVPEGGRTMEQGGSRVSWDRLDSSGHRAASGCYFARLRTASGSSRGIPFVLL